MNSITLHGRLGRDPEVDEKNGPNGSFKVASFSIAVNRDYGDETDWFRCEVIGKGAEIIEKFFRKGKPILLRGQMESYKTDRDNLTHWKVKVDHFWFCDDKSSGTAPDGPDPKDSFEDIDEDVPF